MSCLKFQGNYEGPGKITTIINGVVLNIKSYDNLTLTKLENGAFSGVLTYVNSPSGNTGTVNLIFTRNNDQLVSGNNGLDILTFRDDGKLIHTFTPPTTAGGRNISGIIVYDKIKKNCF
jgi:hypothetical protein